MTIMSVGEIPLPYLHEQTYKET